MPALKTFIKNYPRDLIDYFTRPFAQSYYRKLYIRISALIHRFFPLAIPIYINENDVIEQRKKIGISNTN